MTELERTELERKLMGEIGGLRSERGAVTAPIDAKLAAAEAALEEERFRDLPQYAVGTVVVVPRVIFGKQVSWPAKITDVVRYYYEGRLRGGEPYRTRYVSYRVVYTLRDGRQVSDSFQHKQVALAPEGVEA
jgi:hypothetical protein